MTAACIPLLGTRCHLGEFVDAWPRILEIPLKVLCNVIFIGYLIRCLDSGVY